MTDTNRIISKFTSRKFWVCIIGIFAGLATSLNISENEYALISGMVTSAVSVITYITSEAMIDASKN